ncbi:phosphate ABC transporter ATP-binding protein PstB [Aerosakkonema sp. BLCC-F183]|uniref:phosphate ABC transporter ATP-binding protein PstB n=1 Tax=Aerosakkonema sp. BLCC-F183 TaxID=3342834 RepID=UPI0035B7827C
MNYSDRDKIIKPGILKVNSLSTAPQSTSEELIPALKVENLSCYYGDKKAVHSVSMDIYQGQITAIIGPSGCGKSTFIKALNRISELEGKVRFEGSVEFFGQNIYSRRVNLNKLRRQIGMVFQKPNPFAMSIYDNVAYGVRVAGRKSKGELDEIVESALKGAAIWDEVKDNLKKSALGLSGGQQQRLCIARALAVKPKIMLMDEPCSALDPIATMKIEELLQTLREELTIAIVTHNMQQASRVSDYTAFFNTDESRIGQLIEFGPTAKIFTDASEAGTRDYIAGRFG